MPGLTNQQLAECEAQVRLEGWKVGYERGWEEYLKRRKVRLALDAAQARYGESLIDLESLMLAAKLVEVSGWTIRLANAPSTEEAVVGNGRWNNGVPVHAQPEPSGHSGGSAERWKGCDWRRARVLAPCPGREDVRVWSGRTLDADVDVTEDEAMSSLMDQMAAKRRKNGRGECPNEAAGGMPGHGCTGDRTAEVWTGAAEA